MTQASPLPSLHALIQEGRRIEQHRPWPRTAVDPEGWTFAARQLAAGHWTLLGLWGEADQVHMALLCEPSGEIGVITLACLGDNYPSVGFHHAPAIRLERAAQDLFGLEPEGLPDARPWLDHGRWGVRHPLGRRTEPSAAEPSYRFLPAEGEGLHQIPVGPVHAGIIEPGHFRFSRLLKNSLDGKASS